MKKENPNVVKTTKQERRKKFSHFKDAMHRNFGTPSFTGIGEAKPMYCTVCKERVYKAHYRFIDDLHYCFCDTCLSDINKYKEAHEKKKKEIV